MVESITQEIDVRVIDNFLDVDYIKFLHSKLTHHTPHYMKQKSYDEDNSTFYISNFNITDNRVTDSCIDYVRWKLNKNVEGLDQYKIYRAYINVQHYSQEGNWHSDDGDLTVLLMVSDTCEKGSCFEIRDDEGIKPIPFKQNRLILFPAQLTHRGRAPTENSPRITLAFKMKKIL